jgi:hypothetical protein
LSDPLAGIVRRWLLGAADDLIAAAVELTELDRNRAALLTLRRSGPLRRADH